ncbi:glycosyltransferase [Solicola sp. PLA-1-18]|uniref:glycosyltransferase n=1 Tax=Solicola sp. PLA-1-18 TaxID=3380532 RepID=UPI003B8020B9
MSEPIQPAVHTISVVVPVYQGEHHLPGLIKELAAYTTDFATPAGHVARVAEVLLVHDHGPDDSARVMRELAAAHEWVRPVWLSRNFGQHAATLAGMSSSGGDWIATIDEDGQQDPGDVAGMLDAAMAAGASLVYARPVNEAPHGAARNAASFGAKWLTSKLTGSGAASSYNSFRLVLGEVGRSVAAYAGSSVYLDVALGWVAGKVVQAPVHLRDEGERTSGYNLRSLMSHFWRLVLSSGTRGLRLVSIMGVVFALLGVAVAVALVVNRLLGADIEQGWTSTVTVVLIASGAILFALGVVAEYVGVAVNTAMGKPLYLIVGDPREGPLGRDVLARRPAAAPVDGE